MPSTTNSEDRRWAITSELSLSLNDGSGSITKCFQVVVTFFFVRDFLPVGVNSDSTIGSPVGRINVTGVRSLPFDALTKLLCAGRIFLKKFSTFLG